MPSKGFQTTYCIYQQKQQPTEKTLLTFLCWHTIYTYLILHVIILSWYNILSPKVIVLKKSILYNIYYLRKLLLNFLGIEFQILVKLSR